MPDLLSRILGHPATHAAGKVLLQDLVDRLAPTYRATHGGIEDPEAMIGGQLPRAREQHLPPHLIVMGACTRLKFRDPAGREHELPFPRPLPWLLFEPGTEDELAELVLHRGESTYGVSVDKGAPLGSLTRIGDLVSISYVTRKGDSSPEAIDEYTHPFSQPYPWLCVARGRRTNDLMIVRGESSYDVTPQGIER